MDPLTIVVGAVASGAAVALKSTAELMIKDGYNALKGRLQSRFPSVDLAPVETKPESGPKRESLKEDLADAGAASDEELQRLASELIRLIESRHPDVGPRIGVDLRKLHVKGNLTIEDATGEDGGVRGEEWTVEQDLTIRKARGGSAPN